MKKKIFYLFVLMNLSLFSANNNNFEDIPDSPSDLFRESQSKMEKKQYNGAIDDIKTIVSKNPGNASPHIELARAYIKSGNIKLAYSEYEKAVSISGGNDGDLIFEYGDFAFRDKMYEKAMNIFLKDKTGSYKNDFGVAVSSRFLGNYARAETYYKRVIGKNSSITEAYLGLAITYQLKKDYDNAVVYFEKYIQRKKSEEVYIVLSSIYIYKKDYSNAKRIVEKGIADYPDSEKLKKISQEVYSK